MAKVNYPRSGTRSPEAKARRESHWRRLLQRWKRSGLPKTEFAQREKISPDVLYWWDREIERRDQTGRRAAVRHHKPASPGTRRDTFIPVRVVGATPPAAPSMLEVVAGGRVVRVRPGFDPETLRRLVAVLEDRAC
jgi:transposase